MEHSIMHSIVKGLILGIGLMLIFFAYIGISTVIGRWPAAILEVIFIFSYLYTIFK